jgi:hypothetical protein
LRPLLSHGPRRGFELNWAGKPNRQGLGDALRHAAVAEGPGERKGSLSFARLVQASIHETREPIHAPASGVRDEGNLLLGTGLEADRGTGRNVEMHPVRLFPVKVEGPIGLEEVEV